MPATFCRVNHLRKKQNLDLIQEASFRLSTKSEIRK